MVTKTAERRRLREYEGIRGFIERAEALGELQVVEGADWNLEIGTITELNAKKKQGAALLFDRIKDYPPGYRILTNSMTCASRLALVLGLPTNLTDNGLVEALRGKPRQWEQQALEFPPEEVGSAPFMENVRRGDDINMFTFPTPLWHELDVGRYIGTGCNVITRDPDTGQINAGTYRIQIQDDKTVSLMISPGKHGRLQMENWHAKGQACPVALSFGHDPLLFCLGAIEIPLATPEYYVAGAIRGEPLPVVKGPVTGLPIPADAEIVIEGFVPPDEVREEGPFGEWTGYYARGERAQPIVKIEAVYYRNNPIILGSPPGRPPYDFSYFRTVVRSSLLKEALERAGVPDVRGVWAPMSGGSRLLIVVAIKQRYAGHARQAGFVASQCREGAYAGRYVIVVDEDIDPTNTEDVLWAMCTRSDPVNDIDFIRRAYSTALDPLVRKGHPSFNSRAIIDACRPWEWMSEFPAVSESSPELVAKVREKWKDVLDL